MPAVKPFRNLKSTKVEIDTGAKFECMLYLKHRKADR